MSDGSQTFCEALGRLSGWSELLPRGDLLVTHQKQTAV